MGGKTLALELAISKYPQPSRFLFVSARTQERLILHALKCGHNVSLLQRPVTSAINSPALDSSAMASFREDSSSFMEEDFARFVNRNKF